MKPLTNFLLVGFGVLTLAGCSFNETDVPFPCESNEKVEIIHEKIPYGDLMANLTYYVCVPEKSSNK